MKSYRDKTYIDFVKDYPNGTEVRLNALEVDVMFNALEVYSEIMNRSEELTEDDKAPIRDVLDNLEKKLEEGRNLETPDIPK